MPLFERITLIIESLPGARAQVQVNIPTPTPGMRLETPAHALAIDALGWLGKQPAVAGFVYSSHPITPPEYLRRIAELEAEVGAERRHHGIRNSSAVRTLLALGYSWHGTDAWQPPAKGTDALTPAALDVLKERHHQVHAEGWTAEHDDLHYSEGELSDAAVAYATDPYCCTKCTAPPPWPWTDEWWKPTTPRRDLVKAAALLIAEIDRLDRAEQKAAKEQAA